MLFRSSGPESSCAGSERRAPFKFLDAYTEADADLFFGRELEIEQLYRAVFSHKATVVFGASGTGKTSLVRCGLFSRLEKERILPVRVRFWTSPAEAALRELEKLAPDAMEPRTLASLADRVALGRRRTLILLFDQFEELFILYDESQRREFVVQLGELIRSDADVRVILSLREEYLAHLAGLEPQLPGILRSKLWLRRLGTSVAGELIEGPCSVCGVKVEEAVVREVTAELGREGRGIELPLLQVVMDALYRRAVEEDEAAPVLRESHLTAAGGLRGILSGFVERQVADLGEAGRSILKSMVTTSGTKLPCSVAYIGQTAAQYGEPLSDDLVEETLRALVDRRLVLQDADTRLWELRHDMLAAMVSDWMTGLEKELAEVRLALDNRLSEYRRRGRTSAALLDGAFLSYLAPYRSRLRLSDDQTRFLEASERAHAAAGRRRRRFVATLAAVILLSLSALSLFLWSAWQRADRNAAESRRRTREAELARTQAEASRRDAESARVIAQKQSERTLINALTGEFHRLISVGLNAEAFTILRTLVGLNSSTSEASDKAIQNGIFFLARNPLPIVYLDSKEPYTSTIVEEGNFELWDRLPKLHVYFSDEHNSIIEVKLVDSKTLNIKISNLEISDIKEFVLITETSNWPNDVTPVLGFSGDGSILSVYFSGVKKIHNINIKNKAINSFSINYEAIRYSGNFIVAKKDKFIDLLDIHTGKKLQRIEIDGEINHFLSLPTRDTVAYTMENTLIIYNFISEKKTEINLDMDIIRLYAKNDIIIGVTHKIIYFVSTARKEVVARIQNENFQVESTKDGEKLLLWKDDLLKVINISGPIAEKDINTVVLEKEIVSVFGLKDSAYVVTEDQVVHRVDYRSGRVSCRFNEFNFLSAMRGDKFYPKIFEKDIIKSVAYINNIIYVIVNDGKRILAYEYNARCPLSKSSGTIEYIDLLFGKSNIFALSNPGIEGYIDIFDYNLNAVQHIKIEDHVSKLIRNVRFGSDYLEMHFTQENFRPPQLDKCIKFRYNYTEQSVVRENVVFEKCKIIETIQDSKILLENEKGELIYKEDGDVSILSDTPPEQIAIVDNGKRIYFLKDGKIYLFNIISKKLTEVNFITDVKYISSGMNENELIFVSQGRLKTYNIDKNTIIHELNLPDRVVRGEGQLIIYAKDDRYITYYNYEIRIYQLSSGWLLDKIQLPTTIWPHLLQINFHNNIIYFPVHGYLTSYKIQNPTIHEVYSSTGRRTNLRVCQNTLKVVPVIPFPAPETVWAPEEACREPVAGAAAP